MARWKKIQDSLDDIPTVRLRRLIPEAKFIGCDDLLVTGYTSEIRRLEPGQVFVAVRNGRMDGHRHLALAVERGAAGVITERELPEGGHPQVVVPDTRRALARIANAISGQPSRSMQVFAVTGAAGKTATCWFLRSILEEAGHPTGLLGPEDWFDGRRSRPRPAQAPSGAIVAELLRAMADTGCSHAILELPLDAVPAGACEDLSLAGVIVNQVEREAWGEIPSLSTRHAARLLRAVRPGGFALVSRENHPHWLVASRLDVDVDLFDEQGTSDLVARVESISGEGTRIRFGSEGRWVHATISVPGLQAVKAAVAAADFGWKLGLDLDSIARSLELVSQIPGRLERIALDSDREVWVDRARSGVELQNALEALRDSGARRIHCVMAVRDEQDSATRLALSQALERYADCITLTPAVADPVYQDQFIDDALAGFVRPGRVRREIDRSLAIRDALAGARPDEVVLLAGRGAERVPGSTAWDVSDDATIAKAVLESIQAFQNRRSA